MLARVSSSLLRQASAVAGTTVSRETVAGCGGSAALWLFRLASTAASSTTNDATLAPADEKAALAGRGRLRRVAKRKVSASNTMDGDEAETMGVVPVVEDGDDDDEAADDDEVGENEPVGRGDALVYKTPKPQPLVSPLPADTPDHVLERHRVRVDNLLAQAGFCARREARQFCRGYWVVALKPDGREERILTGKTRVLPWELRVEGEGIEHAGKVLTIAMHKPVGVVCSHADDEGESVYDLLPQTFLMRKPLLSSIGRLDRMSSGLLLFTQDGQLNHLLSNPGAQESGFGGCPKEYIVSLEEELSESGVEAAAFSSGRLQLVDGSVCAPALLVPHASRRNVCKVTLGEGKHHQLRRMFAAIGHAVTGIHRVSYGGLRLPDLGLKPGEWRILEQDEVQRAIDAATALSRGKGKGKGSQRNGDGSEAVGIKPSVPPLPKSALPYLGSGMGIGGLKLRLPRIRIAKEMPKLADTYHEERRALEAEADRLDREEAQAKAAEAQAAREAKQAKQQAAASSAPLESSTSRGRKRGSGRRASELE